MTNAMPHKKNWRSNIWKCFYICVHKHSRGFSIVTKITHWPSQMIFCLIHAHRTVFYSGLSFDPVAGLGWENKHIWLDRKSYFKGVRIFKSLSHILVSQFGKCNVIPKLLRLFRTGIWIWYVYKNTQFKISCAFREEGAFRAITSNISRVVSADYLFANFSSIKPL